MIQVIKKLLFHSPLRLFFSLVILSLSLMAGMIQCLFFFEQMDCLTAFIEETKGADLWIIEKGGVGIEGCSIAKEKTFSDLSSVKGIKMLSYLVLGHIPFQEHQKALIIGFDESSSIGGPTDLIVGQKNNLRLDGVFFIDQNTAFEGEKLLKLGDTIRVGGFEATVGGISVSKSKEPILFTTLSRANQYLNHSLLGGSFCIAKVDEGFSIEEIKQTLNQFHSLEVFNRSEFLKKIQYDLLFEAPIVKTFGITSLLALFFTLFISLFSSIYFLLKESKELLIIRSLGASFTEVLKMGLLKNGALFVISFLVAFVFIAPWITIASSEVFLMIFCCVLLLSIVSTLVGLMRLRSQDLWLILKGASKFDV